MNSKLFSLAALLFSLNLASCAYFNVDEEDPNIKPATPPVAEQKAPELPPAKVQAEPAPAPAAFVNSTPAGKALGWLKNGNTRYLKGSLRKDGQSKKDIARVAGFQAPHSVILSCADSRVPPEIVFDQKLGEIYTIRTLAPAADAPTVAGIEYALEVLGVQNVLVMACTQNSVEGAKASNSALVQDLTDKSPVLAARLKAGQAQISSAIYHLDSGKVDFSR